MDLPAAYVATTESLLAMLRLSHQLGHLNGGLILYLGSQYLLGGRRASFFPLAIVFIAEASNECIQAAFYHSWRLPDTLADIAWTVFWPCMIFAHARLRSQRRPAARILSMHA
jgi:hypothetical protein